jgi:galactose mutarotase-like enzyme
MNEIVLENDELRVVVAPGRGGEIRHLSRPGEKNVLAWYEWMSPLPASRSVSFGRDELDWLSEYRGGWQELFPNGGSQCVVDGTPLPFHGEVSTAQWEVVHADESSATIRCPTRLPLVIERSMLLSATDAALIVEERVWNESPLEVSFTWGHHPAFAAAPGMKIDLPTGTPISASPDYETDLTDVAPGTEGQWPHLDDRNGAPVDLSIVLGGPLQRVIYAHDLPHGWAALRNPEGIGVAMAWDNGTFPHVWLWFEIGGTGFPWFGRSSIVAIEPQSSWPADGLSAARDRGQAHRLSAHSERNTWITLALHDEVTPITGVSRAGVVHCNPTRFGMSEEGGI